MRILAKSLSLIGTASLLAFTIMALLGWFVILDSYRQIERSDAEDTFRRAQIQLQSLGDNHAKMTSDYGIWPDAHNFLLTGNPGFIERNLNEDPFKNLQINFLAYYRTDGSIAWQRAYDFNNKHYIDWPVEIDRELLAEPRLIHDSKTTKGHTGFMMLGDRLVLLSLQPVMRTRDELPVVGSVLFGRFITKGDADAVGYAVGSVTTINPQKTPACKAGGTCFETHTVDQKTLLAEGSITDIRGRLIARMTLRVSRSIWDMGISNIQLFLIASLAFIGLIALSIYIFLRRAVLTPLLDLLSRIRRISSDKILPTSLHPGVSVEIDEVETALRESLNSLKLAEADLLREQTLAASRDRLAQMGEFARGMVHEINNPAMVAMERSRMVLASLRQFGNNDVKLVANAETVTKSIERLVSITGAMRFFGTNTSKENHQEIPLEGLITQVHARFAGSIQAANIEWRYDPTSTSTTIRCVPYLIEHCVSNLLKNAIEAVQTVPSKWIRCTITRNGHMCQLAMEDGGPGVPTELRAKIMEPFFTTKYQGAGIGLGLSVVERIATHHDGRFWLDESSQHTRFVFEIPVAPSSAKTSPKIPADDLNDLFTSLLGSPENPS